MYIKKGVNRSDRKLCYQLFIGNCIVAFLFEPMLSSCCVRYCHLLVICGIYVESMVSLSTGGIPRMSNIMLLVVFFPRVEILKVFLFLPPRF